MSSLNSSSSRRLCGPLFAAGVLALSQSPAHAQPTDCLAAGTPVASLDMRVLLVAIDGTEPGYAAMKATLDYIGIPHEVVFAKNELLTRERLCTVVAGSGSGRHQAVILTTGDLGYWNAAASLWESALSQEEWSRLWQYEATYRVRQATLYTYPGGGGATADTYGLTPPTAGFDTTNSPLAATLTATATNGNPSGRQVFPYLAPANPVTVTSAWTYLAKPEAGASVTPLLVDAAGNALASINNYADGRKNLALTMDGNPSLVHTLSLNYGIVNWVTKGLYVGQRRVSMTAQPDDMLIADDIWVPQYLSDERGVTYRITGTDYNKVIAWQTARNNNNLGNVVLEMPFNAIGSAANFPVEEMYPQTRDDLTPAVVASSAPFSWMSHTYTHRNLDAPTNYSQTLSELRQNHTMANGKLNLANYFKDAMITPDVSGLNNPEALRAMSDFGIRYVVSDSSRNCGHRTTFNPPRACPAPNAGIYNDLQPNILMVPRYPANLFYNVCTPAEWASEYNHIYRSYWGVDLSYSEILDKEAEIWSRYLMNYDLRPVMFHQPNLCAYDGTRSLLGDLIDRTLTKYNAIFTLPVQSRRLRQVGNLMAERMGLSDALSREVSPLTAKIVPGATASSIVLTNPTPTAVIVPVTGVNWAGATSRETYGAQTTSKVTVAPNGGTATVPGAAAW